MAVVVKDGDVEKALTKLKRLNQQSGLNREVRERMAYVSPSEKRKEKKAGRTRRIKREMQRRAVLG